MISVTLNGEHKNLDNSISLHQAIHDWALQSQTFAVAINEQFVPKSHYDATMLQDGDQIELVVPMQGG